MKYVLVNQRVKKKKEQVRTPEQQKQYEQLERVREKVRALPCPVCGASEFVRCLGEKGQERLSNHQDRHQLALRVGLVVKNESLM